MRHIRLFGFILGAAALFPDLASACGGFFDEESATVSVDQSAARMVFEVDETSVTAHVQIRYVGEASAFAWVIPTPAQPRDFQASSQTMFEELDSATAPRFILITEGEPEEESGCACGESGALREGGGDLGDGNTQSAVTVWSEGRVGPLEYQVVSSDVADALETWLVDNGYAVPASADPAIAAYVASGSYFLAMKLAEDADVSDIDPIRFTFDGTEPCVPLRMTAISTEPELQVLVWIFSGGRAEPESYAQVEPDYEAITIDEDATNYLALVEASVDAAGGRGFVTEYSMGTGSLGSGGGYSEGTPITDPTLLDLRARHPWVTRLFTIVSVNDMTVDPTFTVSADSSVVSNEHVKRQSGSGDVALGPTGSPARFAGAGPLAAALLAGWAFSARRRR